MKTTRLLLAPLLVIHVAFATAGAEDVKHGASSMLSKIKEQDSNSSSEKLVKKKSSEFKKHKEWKIPEVKDEYPRGTIATH